MTLKYKQKSLESKFSDYILDAVFNQGISIVGDLNSVLDKFDFKLMKLTEYDKEEIDIGCVPEKFLLSLYNKEEGKVVKKSICKNTYNQRIFILMCEKVFMEYNDIKELINNNQI